MRRTQRSSLAGVRVGGDDDVVITFRDDRRYFDVLISAQQAGDLVAGLSQLMVAMASSNPPGVNWLRQRQLVVSSEVSFDVEAVGDGEVGIAVKLPGLLPITVEIPSDSARLLAQAILEAADDHDTEGPSAPHSRRDLAS